MINQIEVTVDLSEQNVAAIRAALQSPSVTPTPQLFDTFHRMRRGEPVERGEAITLVDAVGKTLAEGGADEKRAAMRTIQDALRWNL